MVEERLTDLAYLAIEKETVTTLDFDDKFAPSNEFLTSAHFVVFIIVRQLS